MNDEDPFGFSMKLDPLMGLVEGYEMPVTTRAQFDQVQADVDLREKAKEINELQIEIAYLKEHKEVSLPSPGVPFQANFMDLVTIAHQFIEQGAVEIDISLDRIQLKFPPRETPPLGAPKESK